MFGFALLGVAVVGGILGWVIGSLKRRRWWLAAVCIPLPFWLYLPVAIPVMISEGVKALGWWLIGLAMLGFPIMAWIIGAGIGFTVARFGNEERSA